MVRKLGKLTHLHLNDELRECTSYKDKYVFSENLDLEEKTKWVTGMFIDRTVVTLNKSTLLEIMDSSELVEGKNEFTAKLEKIEFDEGVFKFRLYINNIVLSTHETIWFAFYDKGLHLCDYHIECVDLRTTSEYLDEFDWETKTKWITGMFIDKIYVSLEDTKLLAVMTDTEHYDE